ncbi:MAG: hypothetical protein LBM64_05865 [Deltaproteobacteria bacterium]|jgi:hypothetical protein|nr:hypothetical protein [Deltaproteobacteria bacterium]
MKKISKPLCLGLLAVLLLLCAPSAQAGARAAQYKAGAPKSAQPAQPARPPHPPHPVDGVWQTDLAATNKISRLPSDAPADLEHLTMILNAKTGKMLLVWADGASAAKVFKFLSYEGRVYRCSVSGVKDHSYLLDVSQKDRLILKDEQRSLVFRRKDAK